MKKKRTPLRPPPTVELQAIFNPEDDPGPHQFFFIPIYYRLKSHYKHDALKAAWERVAGLYPSFTFKYESLEAFAASPDAAYWWRTPYLPWWGVGDIVGFLDARHHVEMGCVRLSCFKTIKRPSSGMRDRSMTFAFSLDEPLRKGASSKEVGDVLLALLERAKAEPSLKQRHIEDYYLRRLIGCTDWARYLST